MLVGVNDLMRSAIAFMRELRGDKGQIERIAKAQERQADALERIADAAEDTNRLRRRGRAG